MPGNRLTVLATGPSAKADEFAPLRDNIARSEAGRLANLRLALEQIVALSRGEAPAHVVNPAAIPRWRARRR